MPNRETYRAGTNTPELLSTDTIEAPAPTLADQLNTIFNTLPVETRADLATLKAAVKVELEQGNTDVARSIIERASVPPELEELRQQMLEKFD